MFEEYGNDNSDRKGTDYGCFKMNRTRLHPQRLFSMNLTCVKRPYKTMHIIVCVCVCVCVCVFQTDGCLLLHESSAESSCRCFSALLSFNNK